MRRNKTSGRRRYVNKKSIWRKKGGEKVNKMELRNARIVLLQG